MVRMAPAIDRRYAASVVAQGKQPEILRLRELEQPVTAGTTAAPRVTYWRQAMRLAGLWVQPSAGSFSNANWAKLSVAVVDSAALGLVSDGQFSLAVPAFALHGVARRWFPLAIEVQAGDRWSWTFTNDAGVDQTPIVMVRWEIKR